MASSAKQGLIQIMATWRWRRYSEYERDPLPTMGGTLGVAAVMGRHFKASAGKDEGGNGVDGYEDFANIYACCLAPTGIGKTNAEAVMRHIIKRAQKANLPVGDFATMASGPALRAAVTTTPQLCIFKDELAKTLLNKNEHVASFKADLTESFGKDYLAAKAYASREHSPPVEGVHIVFGASTTNEEFAIAAAAEDAMGGFLNRFTYFIVHMDDLKLRPIDEIGVYTDPVPKDVETALEYLIAAVLHAIATGEPHEVLWTPNAREANRLAYVDQREYAHSGLQDAVLWRRFFQQVKSLALILAVSEASVTREWPIFIHGRHVYEARRIVSNGIWAVTDLLKPAFDGNNKWREFVIAAIRKNTVTSSKFTEDEGWAPWAKVSQTYRSNVQRYKSPTPPRFDAVVQELVQSEDVEMGSNRSLRLRCHHGL